MRPASKIRRAIAQAVVVALSCVGIVASSSSGVAHAAKEINISGAGPLGAVTVIGDSVLLGSGLYSPTLPDQLAARGWGPIRFRASGSATSGKFPVANEYRSSFWIDQWQAQGWDPKHVIVNLGVNDSGFCDAKPACAYDDIMYLVNAIGPGHEIWWPTITKPSPASRDVFNGALRRVAAERADFHVWDWQAEFNAGGYRSSDQVHLDPAGYRRRSDRMAAVVSELFSVGRRTGGDEQLPAPTAPASTFSPRPPERVVDTRLDPTARVRSGTRLVVDLAASVPEDTTAVALYVTATRSATDGYLSTGPCQSPPSGATLNFRSGTPVGASTIAAVGSDRSICIFASQDTDVVVDLQGAFASGNGGLRMTPLPTPARLHDTRRTGRLDRLVLDVGGSADAVAINLTAAQADGVGFLTAAGCDDPPGSAALNYAPGVPVSSSAIVPVGDDGTICVTASSSTDVIVDITARFSATGQLAYLPIVSIRTLDTRNGTGGWAPLHGAGQTIDVGVAPPSAAAVTGTITLVRPQVTGFATGYGCVGEPPTSSVNAGAGIIAANSITSAVSNGRLCLTSSVRAQTTFDTSGWWIDR